MQWIFAATFDELRAALPTWAIALPQPEPRELLNPYTNQRRVELTYNAAPDDDYDDPPEEQPPPFDHAAIWDPEPRAGVPALYEALTGDASARPADIAESSRIDTPTARRFFREALCGRPGGPCVCHVPDALREALLGLDEAQVDATAERWTALAKDFARCTDEAAWQAASRASLASLVAFARTPRARTTPWFLWEDAFDW